MSLPNMIGLFSLLARGMSYHIQRAHHPVVRHQLYTQFLENQRFTDERPRSFKSTLLRRCHSWSATPEFASFPISVIDVAVCESLDIL